MKEFLQTIFVFDNLFPFFLSFLVNYWYDMEFDIKFNYFQFVEKILSTMNDSGR